MNLLDIFLLKFCNQFWNKSTQVVIFVEFDDFVGFQSSFVFTIFDSGGALFTRGAMTEQGKFEGLQKLYAWQKCHNREIIFCHLWYSDVTNQEWFQWPSFHYLILTSKFACSMSWPTMRQENFPCEDFVPWSCLGFHPLTRPKEAEEGYHHDSVSSGFSTIFFARDAAKSKSLSE